MHRLHTYPDIRAMFRRLLIATVTGVLAALAVAVFRHSMYLLEWLFLSNDSGSGECRGGVVLGVACSRLLLAAGSRIVAVGMAAADGATPACANGLYGSAGNG